ncbi:MAG: hypothetical protein ACJ75G_07295 [Gaiellaceae bacterium]
MSDDRLQRRADVLAARLEALAAALHAGGVPEEPSAQLLSQASTAVLQALSLEILLGQAAPPVEPRRDLELDLRLAA